MTLSQTNMSADIALRPVTDADREFLLRVYASAREIELAMVPWDDAMKRSFVEHQFDAQSAHYATEYANALHDIITLEEAGEPVGRVYVNRSDEQIAILDLTVLSEFRRRGIGSAVVGALLEEGSESDRTVRVYVETFNPSRSFFLSRGFVVAKVDGMNLCLVWTPRKKS